MDAVEDIKARLSIEIVMGEYVSLKRSGRNWRGLSPLLTKDASFIVSPENKSGMILFRQGVICQFRHGMEGLDFRGPRAIGP